MPVLAGWLDEAFAGGEQPNPHAMALAIVEPDGRPSARMVLCKGIDVENRAIVFFTDRESRKGRALAASPQAALLFYWSARSRQARIEGPVRPTSAAEDDAYFANRPRDSQIAATASLQSQPIASRESLHAQVQAVSRRLADVDPLPRPARWGGYSVEAQVVELWISGPDRVHDRALFRRVNDAWQVERLQP